MHIPKGHDIGLIVFKQDVLEKDFHIPAKAINSYYLMVKGMFQITIIYHS